MQTLQSPGLHSFPKLSERDFQEIGGFIHETFGIKMPDQKRGMVESRLRKRLKELEMTSYGQYKQFLFSQEGQAGELSHFIDAVTTHKTDFFREPKHFEYLEQHALPELIRLQQKQDIQRPISIWSCACSRGDEPYTLAMVLHNLMRPGLDYSILATDISRKMLETGARGVYDHSQIEPVSMALRKKYLLRSRDKTRHLVRIIPELRQKIEFRQLNLINAFTFRTQFDVIFCRNVTIYFDKPTTDSLMERLCDRIRPGGYLFMGHSELLNPRSLPLVPVASTVYQKME